MKATKQTIGLILGVFVAQAIALFATLPTDQYFVLEPPVTENSWTLLTSVYSHAGVGHLISNLVALAILGFFVERVTNMRRFHAFFIVTGVVAGVSQILLSSVVGTPAGVLGASGAIFALMGYSLVGNDLTSSFVSFLELSRAKTILLYVILAVIVTMATASQGVALYAHATGFALGAVAGHFRVLHVDSS